VTQIKLAGAMPAGCIPDGTADTMWTNNGGRYMAIAELHVVSRTEPAHGEAAERAAQLRISSLELARSNDDDEVLRQAQRARYQARTAANTLDSVLEYPGRGQDGQLRDALAVLHNQLQEEGTLRGFPVAVDWDHGTGDLILRVSKPADEPAA
jgi:hypothetical protein